MKNTTRHPAVIDLLGGTSLPTSPPAATTAPTHANAPKSPTSPREKNSRAIRTRCVAPLIVVVALPGWFALRLLSGDDESTPERIPQATSTLEPAPTLDTSPAALAPEPAAETDPTACRNDAGDQRSGPGVIASFEYAYYVTRSGAAVRALTTTDTSLPSAENIQAGIHTVPAGTTHCVRITPITNGIYSVALTEMRPGQPPTQFPQTITAKALDGRWFVDSIS